MKEYRVTFVSGAVWNVRETIGVYGGPPSRGNYELGFPQLWRVERIDLANGKENQGFWTINMENVEALKEM